jgi:hypothetical protein
MRPKTNKHTYRDEEEERKGPKEEDEKKGLKKTNNKNLNSDDVIGQLARTRNERSA